MNTPHYPSGKRDEIRRRLADHKAAIATTVIRTAKQGPPQTPTPATYAFAVIGGIYLTWELFSEAPPGLVSALGIATGAWFGAICTTWVRSQDRKPKQRRHKERGTEEETP